MPTTLTTSRSSDSPVGARPRRCGGPSALGEAGLRCVGIGPARAPRLEHPPRRVRQPLRLRPHHPPARQAARVGGVGRASHRRLRRHRDGVGHHFPPSGRRRDGRRRPRSTCRRSSLSATLSASSSSVTQPGHAIRRRPHLGPDGCHGAARAGARRVHRPAADARCPAAVCTQRGAQSSASRSPGSNDRATGGRSHTADGSSIEADQVVVAAGPHADELEGLPRDRH